MPFILVSLLLLFWATDCSWLTGPDDEEIDPRKYTWTVDTLAYPESIQTHMRSVWGSSANDVYVVGHNAVGGGQMYHYDGNKWTDVKLGVMQGGNIVGATDLEAILGFAADDVWAVGKHLSLNPNPPPNFLDSTLVIHYDGAEWREVETPPGEELHAIGGSVPHDIWVGGEHGALFHYDGALWRPDSIPLASAYDSNRVTYISAFGGNASNLQYALFYEPMAARGHLLSYDGNEWAVLDSFYWHEYRALWMSSTGQLHGAGRGGVRCWEQGTWQPVFEDSVTLTSISGSSDDNLFAVGWRWSDGHGVVHHYNGVDWYRYPELEALPKLLLDVWTDGGEVFVVGYTTSEYPQVTIILHGR